MYYTACLLLTIQWQLLCQAIVSLVCKWKGLLKIVWGGGGEGVATPAPPPPRSAPEVRISHTLSSPIISINFDSYTVSFTLTNSPWIEYNSQFLPLKFNVNGDQNIIANNIIKKKCHKIAISFGESLKLVLHHCMVYKVY